MIALCKSSASSAGLDAADRQLRDAQQRFVEIMPGIQRRAERRFRHSRRRSRRSSSGDNRQRLGRIRAPGAARKAELVHPAAIARFAVARAASGRSPGTHVDVNDVLSVWCRQRRGLRVERLDQRDTAGSWKEILVADRRSSPAELAALRIDFAAWLAGLSRRDRRIVETLALGTATQAAAQKFKLTAGASVSCGRSSMRPGSAFRRIRRPPALAIRDQGSKAK